MALVEVFVADHLALGGREQQPLGVCRIARPAEVAVVVHGGISLGGGRLFGLQMPCEHLVQEARDDYGAALAVLGRAEDGRRRP